MRLKLLLIDGQGGKMGKQLAERLLRDCPELSITAVGTNSIATAAMLKSGVTQAATGENAVVVGCRTADIIVGPIGIVIADALLGEITPKMAQAVAQSEAWKVFIPAAKCRHLVAGINSPSLTELIDDAILKIKQILSEHI